MEETLIRACVETECGERCSSRMLALTHLKIEGIKLASSAALL